MTDLLTQLAEIRRRQGLEPLPDPRVIQGFESGSPPPPPFLPSSVTHQDHFIDEDPDTEEPTTYQSPLVAAAQPPVAPVNEAPTLPAFELIVCDMSAAYRGHAVELNVQERGEVIGVVLGALQRTIEEQLAEIRSLKPIPYTLAEMVGIAEDRSTDAPLRRKPGRPRKVKP